MDGHKLLFGNRYARIVAEILLSMVVSIILSAIVWGAIGAAGVAGLFLLMFSPELVKLLTVSIFAPFVLVSLYGLAKRRLGMVIGPTILGVTAYILSGSIVAQKEDAIAALTAHVATPVGADHTFLAIEGGKTLCDDDCITVIATSTKVVALKQGDARPQQWVIYTQAVGPVCHQEENALLALDFLRLGHPGKCATKTIIADFDNGLLLRRRAVDGRWRIAVDLPDGFHGTVYEYFERLSGQNRLLARHMVGGMDPSLPLPLIIFGRRPDPIDAGPKIDERSFLAAAIQRPVDTLSHPADPFPFDETFTEIERYFGRLERVGYGGTATIEDFAKRTYSAVANFEAGLNPDRQKRRIVDLLKSREPFRIDIALSLMNWAPFRNWSFHEADEQVLDLVFVPLSPELSVRLNLLLESQFALGRTPPSNKVRERARAHINDTNLTVWQRQILKQIAEL